METALGTDDDDEDDDICLRIAVHSIYVHTLVVPVWVLKTTFSSSCYNTQIVRYLF